MDNSKMSTQILEPSDAVQNAAALLGEYSDAYLIICKTPETGDCVEIRTNCVLSSTGLLRIGLDWNKKATIIEDDDEYEWIFEDEDESHEDEF